LGSHGRPQKEHPLSDIFREVEEEVRRERLEKIWKLYGDYIIAGVAAAVIAGAGFVLWQRYQENRSATASAEYDAAVQLAGSNPTAAIGAFDKIAATAPSGYANLAKFAEADTLLIVGQRNRAIAIYESLGNGSDESLIGNAARIRAAWSIAEFAPRQAVEKLVSPLAQPASPWRFAANEVLAYADYRVGDFRRAEKEFATLASDPNAPRALKTRASSMTDLIRSGGEGNFGYVPAAPPPAPTPSNP
jgi:hypothetical protein